MLGFRNTSYRRNGRMISAIGVSLAMIEFDVAGTIVAANRNFCQLLGYEEAELIGEHHRIFVEDSYAQSDEYREFWAKLGNGTYDAREYKRITKDRREVWIQASYNPMSDGAGKVCGVLKVATDITAAKLRALEFESKMAAISRVQAVIEFTPQGNVITANENFLAVLGYRLDEIVGKPHRMFVDPASVASPDYADFWRRLNAGEFISSSFRRIGKGGKEVWIQASYNPVFDLAGKVAKVVKFANDITELTHLGKGLERLAANNVAEEIAVPFSPTYERLRLDFNTALRGLREIMRQMIETAQLVSTGAQEISAASDDLSARTERQAASLEETAAALSQVTDMVQRTAKGAVNANAVVSRARDDAEKSGSIVRSAVDAMHRIEKSSGEIEQIIGVIDEIAFQTNLLALNAGVEAARAGDAGRGFAVVASEVRALAQRSAEAAKAIKSLIGASKTEVGTGVDLVGETGQSLNLIVDKVGDIDRVVAEIANGAGEQSSALLQVNDAIASLDEATQQNAAMSEQATAAAQSLLNEAGRLAEMVGRFHTGQPIEVITPVVRRPPPPPLRKARPLTRQLKSA